MRKASILLILTLCVLLPGCKSQHLYKIVAHRGGYVENGLAECSIESLRETIRLRCYASECDVMATADGKVLVCHPDDSGKVNGLIPSEHTLAEIRAHGKLPNGEEMPSLEDFLKVVKNKRVNPLGTKLWLDIKTGKNDSQGDIVMALSAEIAKKMNACDLVEYLVPSFHPDYPGVAARMRDQYGINCAWNWIIRDAQEYGPQGWAQVQYEMYRGSDYWPPTRFFDKGVTLSIFHTPPELTGKRGYVETGFDPDVFQYYDRLKALFVNHPKYVISRLIEEGYETP
ncbi:MAG: hypothetical protein II761_01095 [Bacteroidales bacterium]|nr:hypothetical protein [Bacteroidales bacterium]MBQ3846138.1 hypothetical protein [Bacteroidales bacterium]